MSKQVAIPSGVAALVVGLLALLAIGGAGTYAYWSDSATVSGANVKAGTLDLTVDGTNQGTAPAGYTWSAIGIADLSPGESKAAVVTMNNSGSVPLTVTATGSATGDAPLMSALKMRVLTGASVTGSGSTYPRNQTCTGGTVTFASASLTTASQNVVPTASAVRIAPGAAVNLCVEVTMPSTVTDNTLQGKQMTPTFVLTAAQATS